MKEYEIDHNRYDKYFQGIKLMRKKNVCILEGIWSHHSFSSSSSLCSTLFQQKQ